MPEEWVNQIHTGDAFDVLADLPAESIHACVTDPPYGLAFMGRSWDDFEPREYQEWCEAWAREVKRVMKPGAHLLAFSGNRTHHRAFSGVEDAGLEIRDTITWHYGSGFPKATDVSKTIDKRADADRETVRVDYNGSELMRHQAGEGSNTRPWMEEAAEKGYHEKPGDEPATDEAKRWDGWKTALKPATEYVVLARKPFDGATVDCVLDHDTGALNIDGCRVGDWDHTVESTDNRGGVVGGDNSRSQPPQDVEGRYPANVVFDEAAARDLDDEVGVTESSEPREERREIDDEQLYGDSRKSGLGGYGDSGGPSRYFYTSKASKSDRTNGDRVPNDHPTVKPTDLMQWLVRLVARPEQIVLDPFVGSGTTCLAAKRESRRFVGVERQEKYADVARARCGLAPEDPSHVRTDPAQGSVHEFT